MTAQPAHGPLEPLVQQHKRQHGQYEPKGEHRQLEHARPHGGPLGGGGQHQGIAQHRGQAGRPGEGQHDAHGKGAPKAVHLGAFAPCARGKAKALPVEHPQHPQPENDHQGAADQVQYPPVRVLERVAQQPRPRAHQHKQHDKARGQAQAAAQHQHPGGFCLLPVFGVPSQQIQGVHRQHGQDAGGYKGQQAPAQHGP